MGMNKKLVFTIAIHILVVIGLHCQESTYQITLEPERSLEKEFYVSEVLDFRLHKANIGVAISGIFDEEKPAQFSEDFKTHLTKAFDILLPPVESQTPLIVRVKKLFISERISTFYELGRCEMELEFLRQSESRLYTLGSFSSVIEKKGLDLTESHHERIVDALVDCIVKFSKSDWKNKNTTAYLVTNQSLENKSGRKDSLKEGLYLSFEGLANNAPYTDSEYDFKPIKKKEHIERYQVYHKGRKKRIKDLFGFSDGESIYISAATFTRAQYFVKSKMIGRYIYFEDEFHLPEMGWAFGWIGTLASMENRGIVLDSKSGLTTVLTIENMKIFLTGYPQLLDTYQKGDKNIELVREMVSEVNAIEKNKV